MTEPTLLPLAAIDLDGLSEALNDGGRDDPWFFNTGSGDVRPGGADWDDGYDSDELEEQGWVEIRAMGSSRDGFEDMEVFAQAVADLRMRDVLVRSLEGKGAFRRFREARHEFPELKDPWFAWSDNRRCARSIKWLLDMGHIDELEADAATKEARSAAAEALNQVRSLGGITYDLAAVPAHWAAIANRLAAGESVTLTSNGSPYASITVFDR